MGEYLNLKKYGCVYFGEEMKGWLHDFLKPYGAELFDCKPILDMLFQRNLPEYVSTKKNPRRNIYKFPSHDVCVCVWGCSCIKKLGYIQI